MDWQSRMGEDEISLKKLVDRLATAKGGGLRSRVERRRIVHALSRKISDTRTFMEECLLGRNSDEKNIMEYQIRMQFPLFSHLDSLFSMTELVFPDANCA
jgi:hypothetical protein